MSVSHLQGHYVLRQGMAIGPQPPIHLYVTVVAIPSTSILNETTTTKKPDRSWWFPRATQDVSDGTSHQTNYKKGTASLKFSASFPVSV